MIVKLDPVIRSYFNCFIFNSCCYLLCDLLQLMSKSVDLCSLLITLLLQLATPDLYGILGVPQTILLHRIMAGRGQLVLLQLLVGRTGTDQRSAPSRPDMLVGRWEVEGARDERREEERDGKEGYEGEREKDK